MECKTLAEFENLMKAILLENEGRKALEILHVTAYFASDNIRTGMFLYPFSNLDEINAAVKLLQRYSLVESHAGDEISIKRETQAKIKKYLKDMNSHEFILKHAISVVQLSAVMESTNPSYICHAKSVLACTEEYPKLAEESILLTNTIMKNLNNLRRSSEACVFGSKAFSLYRDSPLVSHPTALLDLQYHLGVSLAMEHKHKEALELFLALYEKESENSGKREINETLKLIAKIMMEMEFSFSLSINSEARLSQIVFGSVPIQETKDNSVLNLWIEYTNLLISFNSTSKALEIMRNVVTRKKEILDPSDDDICEAMQSLARALADTNQFHEAIKILRNVYDKRLKFLGEVNAKTILTKLDIGTIFEHQGNYSTALTIYTEIAEACERSLGERNKHSMLARSKVGYSKFCLGEYEEACKIFKDLYQKYIDVSGKNNKNSFACKLNIGDILWKQYKIKEALMTFQELWEEYLGVYAPNEYKMIELKIKIDQLRQLESKQPSTETIHSLSKAGNLQNIATFIHTGIDLNGKDEAGKTPLHYAVQFGHVSIAKLLLEKGAKYDVDSDAGATPLQLAENLEMRKLLLAIKRLFEDVKIGNGNKVLQHISEEACIVNIKDKNGYTALHWAALKDHKDIVKLLLEFGADPTLVSDKYNSPLHIAASKGHREIVEFLLQSVGSDKLHDFINGKTETGGNTSLHVAAERGFTDVVKILLQYGAVFSIQNKDGKTPLELANESGCCNLLKLVEELFQDAKKGSVEVISKLRILELNELIVISKARDVGNFTLMQVAFNAKHNNLARMLVKVLKDSYLN